ncbi:hypothetical protein HY415_02395 [Candidatus Kaiserbacteria bacterium]|nr:hypothetical protein [Candidatus Kaiserbacteria bacterium]
MKKIIFLLLFFFFFGLAPLALAQGFVPLASIPGLTEGATTDPAGLAKFFNNLYKFAIGLSAALAVTMIIWEGLRIAANQDSVSIIMDSKGKIYNAVFGLVLVLSPVLVFSIINPSILKLSLNLDKIDLTVTPTQQIRTSTCPGGVLANGQCQVNAVALGLYSSPQPGGWCYQIINCTTSICRSECGTSGCNYQCGNQTQCMSLLGQEVRGTTVPANASCALYP